MKDDVDEHFVQKRMRISIESTCMNFSGLFVSFGDPIVCLYTVINLSHVYHSMLNVLSHSSKSSDMKVVLGISNIFHYY